MDLLRASYDRAEVARKGPWRKNSAPPTRTGGIIEKLTEANTANGMRAKMAPELADKKPLEFRGEVQETASGRQAKLA